MNEKKREPKKQLTEAELTAQREARKKARELDRKAAEELEPRLPKMSYNQLLGEIKRIEGRNRTKESWQGGLDTAFACVLRNVLTNTQTKENPFGKLAAYPR